MKCNTFHIFFCLFLFAYCIRRGNYLKAFAFALFWGSFTLEQETIAFLQPSNRIYHAKENMNCHILRFSRSTFLLSLRCKPFFNFNTIYQTTKHNVSIQKDLKCKILCIYTRRKTKLLKVNLSNDSFDI